MNWWRARTYVYAAKTTDRNEAQALGCRWCSVGAGVGWLALYVAPALLASVMLFVMAMPWDVASNTHKCKYTSWRPSTTSAVNRHSRDRYLSKQYKPPSAFNFVPGVDTRQQAI